MFIRTIYTNELQVFWFTLSVCSKYMYGEKDKCFPKSLPVTSALGVANLIITALVLPVSFARGHNKLHPGCWLVLWDVVWPESHCSIYKTGVIVSQGAAYPVQLETASHVGVLLCSVFSWSGEEMPFHLCDSDSPLPSHCNKGRPKDRVGIQYLERNHCYYHFFFL